MKNNKISFNALYSFALLSTVANVSSNVKAAVPEQRKKPNIVWFLTEDLSPQYLALFNNGKGCSMPNVERLAKEGIIYTNAYSCAPVSSAARTTLITGCYAPRFAGSLHRKLEPLPMPKGLHMFPTYLRRAGYETYNVVKTDYNVVLDNEAWTEINGKIDSWTKRKDKTKPFFMMRSQLDTHESRLQFDYNTYKTKKTVTDPNSVYVHDYLPNTDLVRYTYATFYDRIHDSDKALGKIIELLKKNGELDNTFIFFFGDNGGTLPGTKGYTNDLGLHVPFVAYIPKNYRDEVKQKIGSVQNGLVSFIDFGPTVLNIAGVKVPEQMDGKPFLGKNADENGNKEIFCYGDRYDEMYSFNRVIRKGNYSYERIFQPYHPKSLFAFYRYKQLAFKEWKEMYKDGKLNEFQSEFYEPCTPERLYDLSVDPDQKHNLAYDPKYSNVIKQMRKDQINYIVKKADLGFFPETTVYEDGFNDPAGFGEKNRGRIKRFMEISNYQLLPFNQVKDKLVKALKSNDEIERWWALTDCAYFGDKAKSLKPLAEKLLKDSRAFNRARAMVFLSILGEKSSDMNVYSILKRAKTGAETLLVLNDFTFLVESKLIPPFKLSTNDTPKSCFGVDWRIDYMNECFEKSKNR